MTVANSFRISSCSQRSRGLSVLAIRVPPVSSRWWASCNNSRVNSASPWAAQRQCGQIDRLGRKVGRTAEREVWQVVARVLPRLFGAVKIQVVAIDGCAREIARGRGSQLGHALRRAEHAAGREGVQRVDEQLFLRADFNLGDSRCMLQFGIDLIGASSNGRD